MPRVLKNAPHAKDDRAKKIARVLESAKKGELVVVFGTGMSVGLTDNNNSSLSWKGLVRSAFERSRDLGKITDQQFHHWQSQRDSDDLDDLLAAAEFAGRKLNAPQGDLYARWLKDVFSEVVPANHNLIAALQKMRAGRIPLATLNYDSLIEQATGLRSINIAETSSVLTWIRRESEGVLHLHGAWDAPSTCIFGIRDYQTTLGNDVRDLIQRSLASFKRLLFVGCGDTFVDPNFSSLIRWLRSQLGSATPEHYALVLEGDVTSRRADADWAGFVEPLPYGKRYGELAAFLSSLFEALPSSHNDDFKNKQAVSERSRTLFRDYSTFLIKDCGQMTIEGVRADMDTAQRRFDLEKLFVPITLERTPPDISLNDPERELKLTSWREDNKTPEPFGKVFQSTRRLLLLALPGGGKSLLLKRLAVAYADPNRRTASTDKLPNFSATPVMIRCREWREHIHKPIATLLKNFAEVTGQSSLHGIYDALQPLLHAGNILLLVDGLDEIHDDALRLTFVENLEKFLEEFPKVRLIVTSREAGFSLVAPNLVRFCERFRIAPLDSIAIHSLCEHWHRLMTGDTRESLGEASQLAQILTRNDSLRKLAENPLLLTMLLVVKHGAGRLPPDRVSLYGRAVEVLLDTWNIKGHDPLSPKEAVPQLACVAYELMRQGKQTATTKELLSILEEAREKVPQIRRYARDTAADFLKRVEIRSSLLVEAGYQSEDGATVPFYQFRHLTFQEYLAAVAAVEGHYMDYDKTDTILTPLNGYLISEEWKEVIPMAAVLARKQAQSLMDTLVEAGGDLRRKAEAHEEFLGRAEWLEHPSKPPAPVARLTQCLVEEAEAAPETLLSALQLSAYFARGCQADDPWRSLATGPFGEDLVHQAWLLYSSMQWEEETWARNTCARLAAFTQPSRFWRTPEGKSRILHLLGSDEREHVGLGILTICGCIWGQKENGYGEWNALVKPFLFVDDPPILEAALFAWIMLWHEEQLTDEFDVLNRLVQVFVTESLEKCRNTAAHALSRSRVSRRSAWKPTVSEPQKDFLREIIGNDSAYGAFPLEDSFLAAALTISFYNQEVLPDDELRAKLLCLEPKHHYFGPHLLHMRKQLQVASKSKPRGTARRKKIKA